MNKNINELFKEISAIISNKFSESDKKAVNQDYCSIRRIYIYNNSIIRIRACTYYENINYTYGENWDCEGPDLDLKEYLDKYPDLVEIEECYDCCGCGDW